MNPRPSRFNSSRCRGVPLGDGLTDSAGGENLVTKFPLPEKRRKAAHDTQVQSVPDTRYVGLEHDRPPPPRSAVPKKILKWKSVPPVIEVNELEVSSNHTPQDDGAGNQLQRKRKSRPEANLDTFASA